MTRSPSVRPPSVTANLSPCVFGAQLNRDQALVDAVRVNDPLALSLALRDGANPSLTNSSGYTPLHIAAIFDSLACVPLLIEAGANLREPATKRPAHTALGIFCYSESLSGVEALIAAGVDLNELNDQAQSALMIAIEQSEPCALALLNAGARTSYRVDEKEFCLSFDALGHACSNGALQTLQWLIAHGRDPRAMPAGHPSALSSLANAPQAVDDERLAQCAALLIAAGSNTGPQASPPSCSQSSPPLFFAVERNRIALANTLIDAGAPLDELDYLGRSLQQRARHSSSPEMSALIQRRSLAALESSALCKATFSSAQPDPLSSPAAPRI